LQFRDHRTCSNAVPLHVNIPRTDGRDSDLPSEAVVQEYLQFPNEYFLLVLSFGGYSCKCCPSDNPERKKSQGLSSGEHAGQIPVMTIGKIRIRLAASGAPVAVNRSAVNQSTKVRTSLYNEDILVNVPEFCL
jgi:hypothetical protein